MTSDIFPSISPGVHVWSCSAQRFILPQSVQPSRLTGGGSGHHLLPHTVGHTGSGDEAFKNSEQDVTKLNRMIHNDSHYKN